MKELNAADRREIQLRRLRLISRRLETGPEIVHPPIDILRRARAEESLAIMLADLDWMSGKLMVCADVLRQDERDDLREWLRLCLEKIPVGKDSLS